MSIKVMTRVWEHSKQKASNLLLLIALADNANDEGICWPGLEYLHKKIRMSRRQTQRLIDKLETCGEIYTNQGGSGRGDRTRYLVTSGLNVAQIRHALATYFELDAQAVDDWLERMTSESPKEKGRKVVHKGVKLSTKGRKVVNKRVTFAHGTTQGTVIEPSLEPSIEPSSVMQPAKAVAVEDDPFGGGIDDIPPKAKEQIVKVQSELATERLAEPSLPPGQHEPEPQSAALEITPPVPPPPPLTAPHGYEIAYSSTDGKAHLFKAGTKHPTTCTRCRAHFGTWSLIDSGQAFEPCSQWIIPAPPDGVLNGLCVLCHGTVEQLKVNGTAGYLRQVYNDLYPAVGAITAGQIEVFRERWYKTHWKGQKRERPTPADVKSNWVPLMLVDEPKTIAPVNAPPTDLELHLILYAILSVTGLDYRIVPEVFEQATKYRANGYRADEIAVASDIWREANSWKLKTDPQRKPSLKELAENLGSSAMQTSGQKWSSLVDVIRRVRASGDFAAIEPGYTPALEAESTGEEAF